MSKFARGAAVVYNGWIEQYKGRVGVVGIIFENNPGLVNFESPDQNDLKNRFRFIATEDELVASK